MQIFYYTGIRVSELEFVTVEALKRGYIDIKARESIGKFLLIQSLRRF